MTFVAHAPIMLAVMSLAAFAAGGGPAPAEAAAAKPICGMNTGKPATGEPIPIGGIVGKTGPDDFSASGKAAEAFFRCVNDNGGIHGRPIRYLLQDDKWDPETSAQLGAKLINDDKVVAMVGNSSYVECSANAKLYDQQNVVALIGVGTPRECFTSKAIAPMNAGPRLSSIAAAQYLNATYGTKSYVCIAPNIPNVGTWLCDGVDVWAKSKGLRSTTILVDPGSNDATSTILQAAALKPDAIVLGLAKGNTLPLLAAAEEQGLTDTIKFATAASGYSKDVPGAIGPAWDGKFVANMEFQPIDSPAPDNQNWLSVMDAYAEPSVPRDTFAQAGYLTAKLATQTLLGMDPAKIDRASVTEAFRKVENFQSDILCRPWYFGGDAPRHNANHTLRTSITFGKTWVVRSECAAVEDPELGDIKAYETKAGLAQ